MYGNNQDSNFIMASAISFSQIVVFSYMFYIH